MNRQGYNVNKVFFPYHIECNCDIQSVFSINVIIGTRIVTKIEDGKLSIRGTNHISRMRVSMEKPSIKQLKYKTVKVLTRIYMHLILFLKQERVFEQNDQKIGQRKSTQT